MAKTHSVNVRALAEFALRRGDLVMGGIDRAVEGTRLHRLLQSELGEDWKSEEFVSRDVEMNGLTLRVQGRADAISRQRGLRVLEIKSTQRPLGLISLDDEPAHLAQGQIYAYLLCMNEGWQEAEVTICYCHSDGKQRCFRRDYDIDELARVFQRCAEPYADWLRALDEWKDTSLPTMQSLRFPFDTFREGQQEMAEAVRNAFEQHGQALIEAPTGIGKTAAALFGAVQALASGKITAIFYLTARTTGRRAAEQALERMRAQGLRLRSMVITAKEKICPMERCECFGCPYAHEYYERRRPALREALEMEAINAERIRTIGVENELCPYELSLDISEETDIVICDYNYAFDPRVRLRRHFERKSKVGLLVDEAHNLSDRAREMYSCEISGKRIEELRDLCLQYEGVQSPMAALLNRMLAAFLTADQEAEPESLDLLPEAYRQAVEQFAADAAGVDAAEPELLEFLADANWFVRMAAGWDDDHSRAMILPEGRTVTVRIWCFDPSAYLKKTLDRVGGTAMFSATLSPIEHYAELLGMGREAQLMRLESPFDPAHQLTLRIPVPVRYAERERTAEMVGMILHEMMRAHRGNYLACFPSFAYLEMVYGRYRLMFPDDFVVKQRSGMSEPARAGFVSAFEDRPKRSMLAFIVLGGVFAEGIDLPDERLSGAAIVTTGMPVFDFEREQLRELTDDGFGSGYDNAYCYPGVRRVLQAAGRVIRSETDRGVVLLIDQRYADPKIRELLPPHWRVHAVRKMDALKDALKRFWTDESGAADRQ